MRRLLSSATSLSDLSLLEAPFDTVGYILHGAKVG